MSFLEVLQLLIFVVLLTNTVQLMPALGRLLRGRTSSQQPGFHCTILMLRLTRNMLGLLLVPMSAAPVPAIHSLVPAGILLFLILATANTLLTQYSNRSGVEGIRF